MDNEILGKMIIKTTYMKYRDNNTQEGFAEIILIEKSGVFEQYHGEMNIYILPTDVKFEKERYYQCYYKYNTKKNYQDKTPYVAINIHTIDSIEITEDFDEYIKNKKICWNDVKNNIVYAPYEKTEQYKYIEGWKKEIWMNYTYQDDNKNYLFILPNNKATEIYDMMNDNDKIKWLLEDLKKYNDKTREILSKFIEDNTLVGNADKLYSQRWKKAIELLQSININYDILNKLHENEIIKQKLEDYAKEFVSKKYEEQIKNKYKQLEDIEKQITMFEDIISKAQIKIEKINEEKNVCRQKITKLSEEQNNLLKRNEELKANLEQQQIEYLLRKKESLINISIETVNFGKEYKKEDNKVIIKKYDNLKNAIDEVGYVKHKRMIINPNPKWVSFDDLWGSGFGAMFEMAHKNPDQLYVIIIQNYNLSPCECWSMPIVNLKMQYIDKLPYTEYIGFPNNLWLYFIESNIEDISFPVSEYFNSIFNENE